MVAPVVVVALVPSSALKPMVCSVDVPLAATVSFELLGFRPAPAREPPCEPFFCTFDLFLFGDMVTPPDESSSDAELMDKATNEPHTTTNLRASLENLPLIEKRAVTRERAELLVVSKSLM